MWYVIAGIILAAASGTLGARIIRSGSPKSNRILDCMMDKAVFGSLDMSEINLLLMRLETEEAPEEVMGAMCYEAMAYPPVAEYVCPVCGEKTVYEDFSTGFIEYELQGCRRMIESIDSMTDFQIVLDERSFCQFCTPDSAAEPQMMLRVVTPDTTVENGVSIHDLRLLDSFLQGRLYYLTETDAQLPLKDHSDRLRQLLGVRADQ